MKVNDEQLEHALVLSSDISPFHAVSYVAQMAHAKPLLFMFLSVCKEERVESRMGSARTQPQPKQ